MFSCSGHSIRYFCYDIAMRFHQDLAHMKRQQRLDVANHRRNHYGPTQPIGICECEKSVGMFRKRKAFSCSCRTCRWGHWITKRKYKEQERGMLNPYEELDLNPFVADKKVITKAFRKRSKITHPDCGGSEEAFHKTKLAYEVLSDPIRRNKFDETGQVDETAPDNTRNEAVGLLHSAFEVVMVQMLQTNRKPAEHDIAAKMRQVIKEGLVEPEKQKAELGKAAAFTSECQERFEGGEVMRSLLQSELNRLDKCLQNVQQQIDKHKLALKLLEKVSFRHTKPSVPQGFGKTATMGGMKIAFGFAPFGGPE